MGSHARRPAGEPLILAFLVGVTVVTGTGLAADWPQWRGPNRDGVSAESLSVTNWPPLLAWSNTIAIGESAAVVSEGRLYTMGRSGPTNFLYCLDASTGTNIWTQSYTTNGSLALYGSYGPQTTPTVSGNEVYTFDDGGKLYCFNKTNGTVLWNTALNLKRPQYAFSSSPLIEDNLIYLNGSGAGAAVGRLTHTLVWPAGTLSVGSGYSSAVGMTVDGKRLILFQTATALKAVTTNGVVAWSYPYDSASMSGYAAADPVVWGNKILLYENGLVLLQATTNSVSEVWSLNTDTMGAGFSTPVIVGSCAYAVDYNGDLVRICLADGTVDWNMNVSLYGQGVLTAADGKLILLVDGKLRVFKIGASGFDEEGRTPVTIVANGFQNYGWSPPVLYNGKIYCRVGQVLACYSVSGLLPGPSLSMDTNDLVVLCPQGTVATQAVNIVNAGDATLTWSVSDKFDGRIVRQFKSGWTKFGTSPSMKYDGTNDCLWTADYYPGGSEVGRLSTANGSLLGIKSMGANCYYPLGGIEMEGLNLWAASYSPNTFQCFRLSDMALLRSVPVPSGWSYPCALAIGDGKWWGTCYDNNVYRLNPTNGTVISSFASPDFMSYQFHMGYRSGSLWWGNRQYGYYNCLRKVDATTGVQQSQVRVGQFDPACWIHDVSFVNDTQMWLLTYQHVSGLNEYWAHLVDISGIQCLSKSAVSGSVPAGAVAPLFLTFNGVGAGIGVWPVGLTVTSNGGGPKEKLVTFVVHAAGANHAPVANAGADQTLDATGATTPVTLNGSGSNDPDGDTLRYTWRENGIVVTNVPNPTLNLAPGVHDFTLTVDDYRGGTATDTVRITINAADIAFVDEPVVMLCPQGSVVTQTVTVMNVGTRTLNWTMVDHLDGTNWVKILKSFKIGWNLYATAMKYDATNNCLWASYYYSNEVAKLSTVDGSVLARKYLPGCNNPYGIEMEGTNLWVANPTANNFTCYRLSDMAVVGTVAQPAASWGGGGLAIDGGNWYAVRSGYTNVFKLNPTTGAILATYSVPDTFQYYSKHLGAGEGSLWWGRSSALPCNVLRRMDAASGQVASSVQVGQWNANVSLYDVSYTGSNSQYWVLSYYHNGAYECWAHLVDLSGSRRVTESLRSGSIAAGGSAAIQMTFDGRNLGRGSYPVQLIFASNDPDEPVTTNTVMVIVHSPGVNHPPVANAGPDRSAGIFDPTAPFILDLSGAGSSDPDGDPIRLRWTTNGAPVVLNQYGLVRLGVGSNTFTLTVDDYRGGTNIDTMVFTVTNAPLKDWPEWYGPDGNGRSPETNWLQNWPPVVAWVRPDIKNGGYNNNCSPVVSEGRVYMSGPFGVVCVDAVTGNVIWWAGFQGGNPTCAVDEDRVYAVGRNCTTPAVSCWNKRTGANLWNTTINTSFFDADGAGYYCSPMVYGDLVFLDTAALNKRTGVKVWDYSGHGVHMGRRHTWNGNTYILAGGSLIDPMTGANVQSVGATVGWWLTATSTYGSDKVWQLNSMRTIGGSTLWSTNLSYNSEIYIQPTVVGDHGYFLSGQHGAGGPMICQDLKTGTKLWQGSYWGTWLATGDNKLIAHNGGWVGVIRAGVDSQVFEVPTFQYDVAGGNSYPMIAFADKRIFLMGAHGLTCLYTGYSPPVIENLAGQWDWSTKLAKMCGTFVNTGGKTPVQGYVYWGRTDGGTNAAQWEHCTALGSMTVGAFSKTMSDVPTNAVVFYRCYAENSQGGSWASAPAIQVTTFAPPTVEGEDGLLLHWRLDETTGRKTTDDSPYHHTGILRTQFAGTEWTPGKIGNGLSFPGSQYGLSPASALSKPLEDNWTVGLWVKTDYSGQNANVNFLSLTEYYTESVDGGMKLRGYFWGGVFRVDAGTVVGSSKTLSDGQWHHAGIVREANVIRLYIDGKPDGTVTSQNTSYRFVNIGQLGNDTSHANGTGGVTVDDLRVYTRTFSSVEMAALVAAGGGTHSATQTVVTAGSDDAEETSSGTMILSGTGLNLGTDGAGDARIVGLRFPNVTVPRGATIDGAYIQFTAGDEPTGVRRMLNQGSLVSYSGVDGGGTATVLDGGVTIKLTGNAWKAHPIPAYTVTPNTILTVDFSSTWQCEVHGIGLDSSTAGNTARIFKLWGWENSCNRTYETYKDYPAGTVVRYDIPVGTCYTGVMSNLVFVNDSHSPRTTNGSFSVFSNIRLYENGTGQNGVTALGIFGEAADNSAVFSATVRDLSARTRTRTGVPWLPEAWLPGDVGPKQLTPNVGSLAQAIVDRPGWSSGNAMAFLIQGNGRRVADAFDRGLASGANLKIHWSDVKDVDGDSLPDAWERSVVGRAASAVSLQDDDDGDGIRNISEYWAGTDPSSSSSVLAAQTRTTSEGKVVVCFDMIPAGGPCFEGLNRYYSLQRTENLIGSPWTNVIGYAHILATAARQVAYTNNNVGDGAYYRVKVDLSDGHQTQTEMVLPMDGAMLPSGSNVVLWADAWDQDGSVTKVEFYVGAAKVGQSSSEPYRYVWTNPADGVYQILAVAYDNAGNTATSASVNVQIGRYAEGFVGTNTTAQGTWKGVFGSTGCVVVGNGQILPAWATVTPAGKSDYTWSASTTDGRALQKATPTNATDRIAACWYSSGSFTVDVGISDGTYHTISFYCLDWENGGRRQKVEVFDKSSGALLDTRVLDSSYTSGVYLTWRYKKNVQFKFTSTGAGNAVVSGVFIGAP